MYNVRVVVENLAILWSWPRLGAISYSILAIYVNDIVSQLPFWQHYAIILYIDDILLLAPSVTE